MKCSEIQDYLSAYYDKELATELNAAVAAHLNTCAPCAAELAQFEVLSSMATGLECPETPASVWAAVKQGLEEQESVVTRPTIEKNVLVSRSLKMAAAMAATILIVFAGWSALHEHHEHKEMAEAIEQIATELDSDGTATLLLTKYGGSEVTCQDAITQVGYRPVATKGLPAGYSVESIQVLEMPCCKCTQTACRRPDDSRFFIYEHKNEDTGWFKHRKKRSCNRAECTCVNCKCQVVELDDQLAATWEKGNRHVTMLGVRDEEEIELLVNKFDESS